MMKMMKMMDGPLVDQKLSNHLYDHFKELVQMSDLGVYDIIYK